MTALALDQIHRLEVGDGPPVVLIHGLAEDSSSWRAQLEGPDAVEDARLIAIDLRGHGKTPVGHAEGTLAQLADDLAVLLHGLTGPATVVGFSLGGTVALQAAYAYPALVTKAVVLGTSAVVGGRARQFFLDRIALAEADLDGLRDALRDDTASQVHGETDLDELVRGRMAAVGDGPGYVNAARAMVGVADQPLTGVLPDITCPVVVAGADHDVFCPMKASQMLPDGLPNATYVEVADAGHLMDVEQPAAVSQLIRASIEEKVEA